MNILPANVTYNLAKVLHVFRESVLHNYSFQTENNLFGIQKHIFYMKTVIIRNTRNIMAKL